MFAIKIGALNTGDTFRVVSAFYKMFDCFLDMDTPLFAGLFRVLGFIVLSNELN